MVRLLNEVFPASVCVLFAPSKTTVPAPGVNVALLVQLPPTLMVVAVPAAKVPAVKVTLPLISNAVVLAATLRVPPPLLTVKLLNV